jgi:hypothetical protein
MTTAAKHLHDARQAVERWWKSVARFEGRLKRAHGKPEKRAQLEASLVRVRKALASAERRVARYEPIARAVGDASRHAIKAEGKARARGKTWAKDREREAKGRRGIKHRETASVTVESPYGGLHLPDRVERIVSTVDHLYRRGQIDGDAKAAADRYRWAFEMCPGEIRCALDQSVGGGGGSEGRSPSERQLQAAEWLKEADRLLGVLDGRVLRMVCGEGASMEDVAQVIFRVPESRRPRRRDREMIGSRLVLSLTALAEHWWKPKQHIRGARTDDSRPVAHNGFRQERGETKGQVAHAALGAIYGFEPKGGQPQRRANRKRRETKGTENVRNGQVVQR